MSTTRGTRLVCSGFSLLLETVESPSYEYERTTFCTNWPPPQVVLCQLIFEQTHKKTAVSFPTRPTAVSRCNVGGIDETGTGTGDGEGGGGGRENSQNTQSTSLGLVTVSGLAQGDGGSYACLQLAQPLGRVEEV